MYDAASQYDWVDRVRCRHQIRQVHALHAIAHGVAMASVLTIRKLPEDVQALLRQRAAASGRSVEAEAREILATACSPRCAVDWWAGLAKRRSARIRKRLAIESAELIREGRDAR
jgi:plasmid stability protein